MFASVDYEAVRNVFRLIDNIFQGKVIGIPKIGTGLAKGDWIIIEQIIDQETKNNVVICVLYAP